MAEHQPAPRVDAAAPWFTYVRGLAPAARAVDALGTAVPIGGDVAAGALLVIVMLGVCLLATLLAADLPAGLATGVMLGCLATRSLWSTVSPGTDALPTLAMSLVTLACFRSGARTLGLAGAGLGVTLVAPALAWVLAPVLAVDRRGRWRLMLPLALLATALVAAMLQFRATWATVPCLAADDWPTRLRDLLLPGMSAVGSARLALQQWLATVVDDVHVFGVLTALWGLRTARTAPPGTVAATSVATASAGVAVACGLLPPALTAALLLPWWAPWFGRGLADLVSPTPGHRRTLSLVGVSLLAAAVPVLRHAVVVPDAWTTGLSATTRSVAAALPPTAIVTAQEPERLRQLRAAGLPTLPLDAPSVQACQAARHSVHAIGDAVSTLAWAGMRLQEQPLQAPLATMLADLRQRQLVAIGLSSTALPYAGRHLLEALEFVGISRTVPATAQVGTITRIDSLDARVQVARHGLDLRVEPAEPIGGLPLSHAVVVNVQADATVIDTPPQRLVESGVGAVVVLDRDEQIAFRSAVARFPGLPVSLRSHRAWRHAVVQSPPECVLANDRPAVLGAARRISVPTVATSARAPSVVYATMAVPASISISGLPSHADQPRWLIDTFDRQEADGNARLLARVTGDGVPPTALPGGRHVTRIALAPTGTWPAARVAVSAGQVAQGWMVVLPPARHTPATSAVCVVHGGDRFLAGQFGVMDDDSLNELPVWAGDGWHQVERAGREMFQWSAGHRATVGFRLDSPESLVLAMEASAIATPAGQQALSVHVNGMLLTDDWGGPHRAAIAPSMLRAGDNTIELSVPQALQPPGDPRTLGVLVRQLRLIRAPAP